MSNIKIGDKLVSLISMGSSKPGDDLTVVQIDFAWHSGPIILARRQDGSTCLFDINGEGTEFLLVPKPLSQADAPYSVFGGLLMQRISHVFNPSDPQTYAGPPISISLDEQQLEINKLYAAMRPSVCECGAESVNSQCHSTWCPKGSK